MNTELNLDGKKSFGDKLRPDLNLSKKVLAAICPYLSEPDDYDVFEFEEAFKLLRTNLQMMQTKQSERSVQTVMITSAQAGDGKSTVAWYLAQTAASMGQRVLLVDADLRRSQLQTRLELLEAKGLSEFFSLNLSLSEVIQQPLSESSLHVLPSGEAAPNPIQILASTKMHTLTNKLKNTFDLVIYDAPPLNGLADTLQLASYIDNVLLVVRLNKTDKIAAEKALESLSNTQAHLLGLVANGM
ncbi:CpsD/CapB family tyrosine-protein kinase [bacterium]|nr:CpsD/CapB family tyrosine-protein kinase [bacterium]